MSETLCWGLGEAARISPAPPQGARRGEMRPHTNVCGSGRCLLSVTKRQRENWENSTADADFQLDLSHWQDLGSRWWKWGAEVGGPGGWMEEPRTSVESWAHLGKGEPSSLPAAQEMASEPPPWRALLASLLHPFLRLRRQEGPLRLMLFYSTISPAPPHTPRSSCCLLASLPYSVETLWLHRWGPTLPDLLPQSYTTSASTWRMQPQPSFSGPSAS